MLSVNEAMLEMHFHPALMGLFRDTYGLGPTGTIEFFKYSPQLERFVGFDQAYVRTELNERDLYSELSEAATNTGYLLHRRLYGYFLQFKVVKQMRRRSRTRPSSFTVPYFRAALSTHRKRGNHPSQHELLFSLAQNPGAMVYYACPMVFDRIDLYRPKADLDQLSLVDVASAPGRFDDNELHSLCFQSRSSPPTWCSEPTEGDGRPAKEFVAQLVANIQSDERLNENVRLMQSFLATGGFVGDWKDENVLPVIGDSLTLIVVTDDKEASRR